MEHHEEIVHPNEERSGSVDEDIDPDAPFHWPSSSFVRWFLRIDESHLRPFFIRKYNKRVALLEDEYQELIKQKFDDNDEDEVVDKVEALLSTNTEHPRALSEFAPKGRGMSDIGQMHGYGATRKMSANKIDGGDANFGGTPTQNN